jgi:hypothetical protein
MNSEDRVELKATIVWNFGVPPTDPSPGPEITVVSQQMQFSICSDDALTGTRICTVVDSGEIIRFPQVTPPPGTLVTNTVTTSFECTDIVSSCTTHNYFVTGAAGVADGFIVSTGSMGGAPAPITVFSQPIVTEVQLSGAVIDENNT